MKVKLFLIFIILSNLIYSQNQMGGTVTYNASLHANKSILASKKILDKKVKANVDEILKNATDQTYLLSFYKNRSFFVKEEKMKTKEEGKLNLTEVLIGKGKFYTDSKLKEKLYQKFFMGERFLISYEPIDWNFEKETKQIGKYNCNKATTIKKIESKNGINEMSIIAWYSPQIPLNFGPKEYSGLPGLILELHEGNIIFTAKRIELNTKKRANTIKKPIKGIKLTLKEYNQLVKERVISIKGGKH